MQYQDSALFKFQGHIAAAKAILANEDLIGHELFDVAHALKDECHQLIREGDARWYRQPPCTLTVKRETRKVGPKIVWVTYNKKKTTLMDGSTRRFSKEVGGRKNGRYPKRIFREFDEELRYKLIEIEDRAAAIRQRVSFWRATFKQAQAILDEAGVSHWSKPSQSTTASGFY